MKRINFVPYACRIGNNSKSTRFLTVAGEGEESGLLAVLKKASCWKDCPRRMSNHLSRSLVPQNMGMGINTYVYMHMEISIAESLVSIQIMEVISMVIFADYPSMGKLSILEHIASL